MPTLAWLRAGLLAFIDWCMSSCFHSLQEGSWGGSLVKGTHRGFPRWVFARPWTLPFFSWNVLFSWVPNPIRINPWWNYKIEHWMILSTSGFFSLASTQTDYSSSLPLLALMSYRWHLHWSCRQKFKDRCQKIARYKLKFSEDIRLHFSPPS